jgi:predicted Zn-dependent peptidase
MFRSLDEMDKVSAEDVTRVAQEYFRPEARTEAHLVAPAAAKKEGAK